MTELRHDRAYLRHEERIAGQLRLVGSALLVIMAVVFDPPSGWTPLAVAGAGAAWTGFVARAASWPGGAPPRLHHLSLVVDAGLATACYALFIPDPEAIPPVLFPILIFRLTARYGRWGAVAGVGLFTVAVALRAVTKLWVLENGQVRPAVLLVWVVAAAVTVALALELRVHHRPPPDEDSGSEPPRRPELPAGRGTDLGEPDLGEPAAGAAGLAARLAVRLDHARDGVGLTRREWEVFELLGRDASCRQIAAELHVTVSTVRNHVHNMRVRLGLDTREELIALAHEVRDRRAAL